ncbi:hypothetical protein [Nonomuraea sp. NPDC049129]|uniref:hypothetical protein n=1 Tax=Nonomuraea sp. NPDC049129 TaxID=3155272 RepID=UPI0033FD9653
MHTIRTQDTGVEVATALTVFGFSKYVELVMRKTAPGITSVASVEVAPEELTQLIDFLIYTYNGWVDAGVVDTTKYRLD